MELKREFAVQWTIYDHPKDYPNHFVVRKWTVFEDDTHIWIEPDKDCFLADTLENARSLVPRGFYPVGRMPGDDPAILEVWI